MKTTPGAAGVGPNPLEVAAAYAANSATSLETPATPMPPTSAAVAKQRHAARIHRVRIAIVHIRFARRDAQARRRAADRARGRHGLSGDEICGERASAIRIFDSVERGVWRVGDSRREMNSADEAHGARRKRRLIVAEKRGGACERYRQVRWCPPARRNFRSRATARRVCDRRPERARRGPPRR